MTHGTGQSELPGAGLFLYDRDCGFCQRAVGFARDRVRTRSAFAAWQDVDLSAMGLTPEQADARAWILYPDGRRLAGGDAIAGVLLHGRFPAGLLGHVMLLPGVRLLSRAVYRLVAANRHRLPGGTPACALNPDPIPPRPHPKDERP